MGPAATANDFAFKIDGQGVIFFHFSRDFGRVVPGFQALELDFTHQGVGGKRFAHRGGKALFQPDQVEHVADVQQAQELVLGHDFAESPKALGLVVVVHPRLGVGGELVGAHGPDVGQVGRIPAGLLIGLHGRGQAFEKFRIRMGGVLHMRGGAVMKAQLRGKIEAIRACLDCDFGHVGLLELGLRPRPHRGA